MRVYGHILRRRQIRPRHVNSIQLFLQKHKRANLDREETRIHSESAEKGLGGGVIDVREVDCHRGRRGHGEHGSSR
jgi:hypothetical protein